MSFDVPETNIAETPEDRARTYQQEAMIIAQRLSQQWQELRKKKKADKNLLVGNPKLIEIDAMSNPPVSGIQVYFEGQLKTIDEMAGDPDSHSRMMYRLKEEMEQIEKSLNGILG
jgi:hypothetical protein